MNPSPFAGPRSPSPGAIAIFLIFLRLGLTSFGGPLAHLGYFRTEFVQRRRWLDDDAFAGLLGLCQFLPGPASSQLGFALGWLRGGWSGAVAAFLGFTLPSALLMYWLALHAPHASATPLGTALVHGLKLVAVVVVAHGLWGMARTLAPDRRRIALALAVATLVLLARDPAWQLAGIAFGALAGAACCPPSPAPVGGLPAALRTPRWVTPACAVLFAAGLLWATWPRSAAPGLEALAAANYQSGALVFGGGHVVLPLLQAKLVAPGWIGADQFLAGYGAAQAMPGPMFSLASYLGASVDAGVARPLAAAVALLCIFLPGFLLLIALLPGWTRIAAHPRLSRMLSGINAAVVGLLAAALYHPLWTGAVGSRIDIGVVGVGLLIAWRSRRPALWILAWCLGAAWLAAGLPSG